jgi:lysophospholipase
MAFVRVPGNPEPEGSEEIWFEGRGGQKIRAIVAPALGGLARGSVILCNGRTEFVEKYFEVITELQQRGFAVFSMDWRGQGLSDRELSDRQKGHLAIDDAVADLFTGLRLYAERLPRPHVLIAHSMGGGISLRALQSNKISVDGAVFSAPMWGFAYKGKLATSVVRALGGFGLGKMFAPGAAHRWRRQPFQKNRVTHDKARYERSEGLIAADTRRAVAGYTVGWVNSALDTFEALQRPGALKHLRFPVAVLSAGQEVLVDNESHAILAKELPNARHLIVEGARHEIMMETDELRAQFWATFDVIANEVAPRRQATSAA